MKKVFFILMLFAFNMINVSAVEYDSEIIIGKTIDDFGDETNETNVAYIATGSFSNSATRNSCAKLIINTTANSMQLSLYEYCDSPVFRGDYIISFISDTSERICCKRDELYLKIYIVKILDMCKSSDTIRIKIREIGDYSSLVAAFKLYDTKDFYNTIITQFPIYKSYYTDYYFDWHNFCK